MLQGANRFERGSIFFNYLQDPDVYGPDILNHQVRETVPGVGHDSTAMFASSPALRWLFDFSGPGSPGNAGSELPNVGTGTYSFCRSPASQSLVSLAGPLTVPGGGADAPVLFDTANPNAEMYHFEAAPSSLTLTTVPVSASFADMDWVFLETNGHSTVNDPQRGGPGRHPTSGVAGHNTGEVDRVENAAPEQVVVELGPLTDADAHWHELKSPPLSR
jgi:hypothetical protein